MHTLKIAVLVALLITPIAALADTEFESMPIGCSWSTKYSDGKTLIETFKGKVRGKYFTETVEKKTPNRLESRTTFDRKGRMIRKDWAGGHWEIFDPFSCYETMGTCSYLYKNGDGANFVIENKVKKQGNGFLVTAAPKGGNPYPEDYIELGRFNMMTVFKNANYSSKLLGFANCEAAGS